MVIRLITKSARYKVTNISKKVSVTRELHRHICIQTMRTGPLWREHCLCKCLRDVGRSRGCGKARSVQTGNFSIQTDNE